MTIVWDVDDVLNAFTREWLEQEWRVAHPKCRLHYDELSHNPPHELLGVSEAEYLRSIDQYRLSMQAREAPPVPEVLSWFETYGTRCSHIALTARPLATIPPASAWVFQHFGKWIRAFGFVPSLRSGVNAPAYHSDKGEWMRWISAGDILVDDNPGNLAQAAALSLDTVLMPQPWNDAKETLSETLNSLARLAEI